MDCPICHHNDHVEVDTHANGFARDLHECGDCGSVWTLKDGQVELLHGATKRIDGDHQRTECPVCHNRERIEVDIHADGFAQNLEECGICGALWTLEATGTKIVHGPTWAQSRWSRVAM